MAAFLQRANRAWLGSLAPLVLALAVLLGAPAGHPGAPDRGAGVGREAGPASGTRLARAASKASGAVVEAARALARAGARPHDAPAALPADFVASGYALRAIARGVLRAASAPPAPAHDYDSRGPPPTTA